MKKYIILAFLGLLGCSEFMNMRVMSQSYDGTLVFNNNTQKLLLIERNPVDSKLFDDDQVPRGDFEYTGTYQYQNIMGGVSTIRKIRRLK